MGVEGDCGVGKAKLEMVEDRYKGKAISTGHYHGPLQTLLPSSFSFSFSFSSDKTFRTLLFYIQDPDLLKY